MAGIKACCKKNFLTSSTLPRRTKTMAKFSIQQNLVDRAFDALDKHMATMPVVSELGDPLLESWGKVFVQLKVSGKCSGSSQMS